MRTVKIVTKKRNMSTNFGYYIFCLVVLIVGFMLVKKVAGCLIKSVIAIVAIVVLAAIYCLYLS